MHISFSPMRHDARLVLSRKGDALTINGEVFDFAPLPEGASLPAAAINSPWFADNVTRIDGVLHLSLILPHGLSAPMETLFPAALAVTGDGPITLPPYSLGDSA